MFTLRVPSFDQVVIDFARAEDQPLDSIRIGACRTALLDQSLELRPRNHLVIAGAALRQTQQGLGRHDDERLPEGQTDLSSQDVEIVGRCGAVGNDHVDVAQLFDGELFFHRREVLGVVGAKLQKPFRTRRGVLRTHAFHAVRQQHDQSRLANPLGLAAGQELIDDALGGVGEVSELRFPQHQGVRVRHGVAQLEAKDSVFRQRRIANSVGCLNNKTIIEISSKKMHAKKTDLIRVEIGQRIVGGPILVLVMQNVMSLRKCSSLHILT